jgi:hypothetical protein
MLLTWGQRHGDCPASRLYGGRQFGVEASLAAPDRLAQLAARRIGAVLVQLDVRAIQVPELAGGFLRQLRQQPGEEPASAPAAEAGID